MVGGWSQVNKWCGAATRGRSHPYPGDRQEGHVAPARNGASFFFFPFPITRLGVGKTNRQFALGPSRSRRKGPHIPPVEKGAEWGSDGQLGRCLGGPGLANGAPKDGSSGVRYRGRYEGKGTSGVGTAERGTCGLRDSTRRAVLLGTFGDGTLRPFGVCGRRVSTAPRTPDWASGGTAPPFFLFPFLQMQDLRFESPLAVSAPLIDRRLAPPVYSLPILCD